MFCKGLITLICVFLSILPLPSPAQKGSIQPFFRLNLPQNFPNKFINSIIRDQNGLLWLGTNNGLCRYISEKELKVYNSDNVGELKSNIIVALLSDSRGNIWIGTRHGGITRYNPRSNHWTSYINDPLNSNSLSNDDVLCLSEDHKGRIWIGTENGLNMYLPEKDSFFRFTHNPADSTSLSANAVLSIYEDHARRLWVGTWAGGLSLLIPNEANMPQSYFKRISLLNMDGNQESVWKVFQDSENRYWICSHFSGLYLMQLPKNASAAAEELSWTPHFHNYAHSSEDFTSISSNTHIADIGQDSRGHLWIGTSYGLSEIPVDQLPDTSHFNTPTEEKPPIAFRQHIYDPYNIKSINSNKITTILIDEQELVWIGTDRGVTQYNWFARQIKFYQIHSKSHQNVYISEIFVPQKEHAIISYFTGEVMDYHLESGVCRPIHEVYDFIEPISDALHFFESDRGILYITRRSGISKIDFNKRTTIQLAIPLPILNQLEDYRLKSVHIDTSPGGEDKIWIGSENGLYLVYNEGKQFKIFKKGEALNSISDNSITDIEEDSTGRIWISTHNGLNLVEEIGDSIHFKCFLHDANDSLSLPDNRLLSIICLKDRLVLGSRGGLLEYKFAQKKFNPIGKDLFSHAIISLISPNDSNVWAITADKILHYHVPSGQILDYGDMEISFFEGSIHIDRFDRVFVGGFRGFAGFEPQKIIKNELPPLITITQIQTSSPVKEESIEIMSKENITLGHDNYKLTISFSSSNFNQAEENQFAYRMLGLEEDWIYTPSFQPVSYTNLKHGSYQFQVKGRNNDGVWSEKPRILNIKVEPAFWETPIFRVLIGLVSFALIFLFTNFYTKNVRNQNQKLIREISKRKEIEQELIHTNAQLEKSNKELEQFAFVASHDLREPLQSIDSFSTLLRREEFKERLGEKGSKYVDFISQGSIRMKEIIQSLLTYSTSRHEELQVQLCNFHTLVQESLTDLSKIIKEKNVRIEVAQLPSGYGDPVQIRMVFNNLIVNAIKFNQQEVPVVQIWSENTPSGGLQFAVKDNGIGIDKEFHQKVFGIFKRLHHRDEFPGSGIGLALCHKIIERHRGKIWIESNSGEGSTFWFELGNLSAPPQKKEQSLENKSIG